MLILEVKGCLLISYDYLRRAGLKAASIENWRRRNGISICKIDGRAFIDYKSIPNPSKSKIPSEADLRAILLGEEKNKDVEDVYKKLQYAKFNKFLNHRVYYRDKYGLSPDLTLETSMKRASWDRLMQLYNENKTGVKGGLKKGFLEILHKAYDKVYPGRYSTVNALLRAIKTSEQRGVDAVCVDQRKLKSEQKPAQKYDERHLFLLRGIISSGKAYKSPKILELMKVMCLDEGIESPSLSWVKANKQEILKNIEIHENRYGSDKTDKVTPYSGVKPAFYADDQYQIDGWDMPFYYLGTDSNKNPRLKKLTLVAVRDACTKKIVGYSVGRSENRLTLFEALQDATANTGALPFELVSDNHSYNETKEVGFFKEEAERLGFTWTVDSNPKRKAIAERYFGVLGERFCKDHYGYIGQGIRTRDKDGRSKQELIDKYQKSGHILTEEEIKVIAVDIVHRFNNTPLKEGGKTPNQLYEASQKPNRIEIDLFERLRLFTKRTEYKVSRGQINIEIAGIKYEYQLPASFYSKYDRTTVAVRYDSPELIYLFDRKTDQPITSLEQKEKAAGALANQTERDIEIMNRSTGRLKGIKAMARKENEEIAKKASELSPGIFDTLNKRLTPKDVYKMAEEEEIKQEAERRGIDFSRIAPVPVFSEIENPAFKAPKLSRKEMSPFAPENHQISVIEQDDY